jgi:hypothetical protein
MEIVKLILFVFLGAVIHLGFKFKAAYNKEDFKPIVFIKKNVIGSIMALLCGITLILLKDDVFNMFGILINNFMAFFIGYTGDSMFKQLMKKAKTTAEKKINDKK